MFGSQNAKTYFSQKRKNAKKIYLAKQKRHKGNAERNFQDERMSRIFFSQKREKDLSRKGC
jgi:hypothetical protein